MNNEHFILIMSMLYSKSILSYSSFIFFKFVNFYRNIITERVVWENASTIFHKFSLMISHEKHTSQKAHKKCLHLDRISLFIPHILSNKKEEEKRRKFRDYEQSLLQCFHLTGIGKIFPTFQQNKEINF